jgi:hypothetical protein
MKAIVREAGYRPAVANMARLNAPQGAKVLADLLAEESFADMSIITLDWVGDGYTPVMTIFTVKWFPEYGGQRLEHEWNVDLDDAFGQDNMTNSTLRQMVVDLREVFEKTVESRRRQA